VGEIYTPDDTSQLDYSSFGMITVGRSWSVGSEYTYGFNGMEIENEILNEKVIYTSEYRGYDARLGRWMSLDPISKSWLSPYVGFSNNPIIRVDPRGNDDYFDIDGNYVGNDGTSTNKIRIVRSLEILQTFDFYQKQKDGSKLVNPKYQAQDFTLTPSQFYYAENGDAANGGTNAKAISYNNYRMRKILFHYIGETISGVARDDSQAFFDPKTGELHYLIHKDGKISEYFDNVFEMKSVICDHEDIHREDYKDPNFRSSFRRHAEIYLNQIESDIFDKTSQDFQIGIIAGSVDRFIKANDNYDEMAKDILKINGTLKAQGINLEVVNFNPLGVGSFDILDTKNKTSYHHEVKKITSPEN